LAPFPALAAKVTKIVLKIGDTVATVNDQIVPFEVAPVVIDGRTMVPLRFISESLGADVERDEETDIVTITHTETAQTGGTVSAYPQIIKDIEISASDEPQGENPAANASDGDLNTRWSAQGKQWLQGDLGETRLVSKVSIAFLNSNARKRNSIFPFRPTAKIGRR
jgi:hypothetical protein